MSIALRPITPPVRRAWTPPAIVRLNADAARNAENPGMIDGQFSRS